ncbi:Ig-like domain-containing protein [Candidatus Poribacteria bacterium]
MKKTAMICYILLVSLILIIACGEDEEDTTVLDTTPPEVKYVIVAGWMSAAATNGSITVVFSEAVEPASVQAAVTSVPQVDGSISYDEETRELVFEPESDLQDNTKYSVTISNAMDRSGNVMVPYTFDLTTGTRDTEPPAIVKTVPGDGEEEVSIVPKINVEFSERIKQARFAIDLKLTPDPGIPVEKWVFTWSEDGTQVEIWLPMEKGLEPERKFKLDIGKSSVVDLVGNRMEEGAQLEFTTATRPHEDINPNSVNALQQEWLYIIWKNGDKWQIIWGGTAPVGAVRTGAGTIFSEDGEVTSVTPLLWEAGDTQNLSKDGKLTFNGAVNGTGGTDGLEFEVDGKTVTFRLSNAQPEWIFIGKDRKHPVDTTFTLVNE